MSAPTGIPAVASYRTLDPASNSVAFTTERCRSTASTAVLPCFFLMSPNAYTHSHRARPPSAAASHFSSSGSVSANAAGVVQYPYTTSAAHPSSTTAPKDVRVTPYVRFRAKSRLVLLPRFAVSNASANPSPSMASRSRWVARIRSSRSLSLSYSDESLFRASTVRPSLAGASSRACARVAPRFRAAAGRALFCPIRVDDAVARAVAPCAREGVVVNVLNDIAGRAMFRKLRERVR